LRFTIYDLRFWNAEILTAKTPRCELHGRISLTTDGHGFTQILKPETDDFYRRERRERSRAANFNRRDAKTQREMPLFEDRMNRIFRISIMGGKL
jgi:hypothetical protein